MATTTPDTAELDAIRQRLRESTPFWAESLVKIINKQAELIPFKLKPGQLALDEALEKQRLEGKPMRAIVLKARQLGFSTYTQAKLIHRCTQRERYSALVVAQDRPTGAELFRMGETIYGNLPEGDEELKPAIGPYTRGQRLHFVGEGDWKHGESYPDSRYRVDTAGEFQAGRGGTYRAIHASEVAFWDQIGTKLKSLTAAVPDDPESLFIMESTANGYNEFRDRWEEAEQGRGGWIPFFWPWWKDDEYSLDFASESEKESFTIGDRNIPYAEKEQDLVDQFELTLEQLHWRRQTISNKFGGDVRDFHQEYPSEPEEAFIATGEKIFDPWRVGQMLDRVERTDPKRPSEENPGPLMGDLVAASEETMMDRNGSAIEVPKAALWVPHQRGQRGKGDPFKMFLEQDADGNLLRPGEYIVAADVSGGKTETTRETDFHSIQVIDHRTREQVAVYRSRIEPEQLSRLILLTALFFNEAWVGIERTGGWGMPVIRILYKDLHYMRLYRPKKFGSSSEKTEDRFGWDTTQRTKPELIAGMAELLRTGEDGIKDRWTGEETRSFRRTEKGTAEAEPGKFDDCLMAYMIAQQIARERPLMQRFDEPEERGFIAAPTGLASYDNRY